MSQLITDDYRALQKRFHEERQDYGISSGKYIEQIRDMAQKLGTRSILDYGCGKALLAKGLPFPIQNYDPCIDSFNRKPEPADIVVCTDVLEHVEEQCVEDVLDDLARLTQKMLFIDVCCHEAKKFLPDGRNAHITLHDARWWLERLLPRFDLHSFQAQNQAFVAILFPFGGQDGQAK